jgi:hypothetical protein
LGLLLMLLLRLLLRASEAMALQGNLCSSSSTRDKVTMHVPVHRNFNLLVE